MKNLGNYSTHLKIFVFNIEKLILSRKKQALYYYSIQKIKVNSKRLCYNHFGLCLYKYYDYFACYIGKDCSNAEPNNQLLQNQQLNGNRQYIIMSTFYGNLILFLCCLRAKILSVFIVIRHRGGGGEYNKIKTPSPQILK